MSQYVKNDELFLKPGISLNMQEIQLCAEQNDTNSERDEENSNNLV